MMGHSLNDFWISVPDGPGQVVKTRLGLWLGQWFLDVLAGTPWNTQVLGKYTGSTRDIVIQNRILTTPGVLSIASYASQLNRNTRVWSVQAAITTVYGIFLLKGPV